MYRLSEYAELLVTHEGDLSNLNASLDKLIPMFERISSKHGTLSTFLGLRVVVPGTDGCEYLLYYGSLPVKNGGM